MVRRLLESAGFLHGPGCSDSRNSLSRVPQECTAPKVPAAGEIRQGLTIHPSGSLPLRNVAESSQLLDAHAAQLQIHMPGAQSGDLRDACSGLQAGLNGSYTSSPGLVWFPMPEDEAFNGNDGAYNRGTMARAKILLLSLRRG
jgi:hypothetical protein